jgi:quinoprotein glucose dehydrogenase
VTLPKYLGGGGNGGVLVTKGGVVFAASDNHLYAFDEMTGDVLAELELPDTATATPMTFTNKDGRQMVAIASGSAETGVLVAFGLPAGAQSSSR